MTGHVRDARTVEVDDKTLTAISHAGGSCYVRDSAGELFIGELVHDGVMYVIRIDGAIAMDESRVVTVAPRRVPAQGAR